MRCLHLEIGISYKVYSRLLNGANFLYKRSKMSLTFKTARVNECFQTIRQNRLSLMQLCFNLQTPVDERLTLKRPPRQRSVNNGLEDFAIAALKLL